MKKRLSNEEKIKQVEERLDGTNDVEALLLELWENYSMRPDKIWFGSQGYLINEYPKRKTSKRRRTKSKRR